MENSEEALVDEILHAKDCDFETVLNYFKILEGFENQQSIIKVAYSCEIEPIRVATIDLLTSHEVLTNLATNDKSYTVRRRAYKKLGLGHTREAIMDCLNNGNISVEDINQITDQDLLKEIFPKISDDYKKEKIIERITDSFYLEDIFNNAKTRDIQRSVVGSYSDKSKLYGVINFEYHKEPKLTSTYMSDDYLYASRQNQYIAQLKNIALERLVDLNMINKYCLKRIGKKDKHYLVKDTVETLLKRMKEWDLFKSLIKRISPKQLNTVANKIIEILINSDSEFRTKAVQIIDDYRLLVPIIKNDELIEISEQALKRIATLAKTKPERMLNDWNKIESLVNEFKHEDFDSIVYSYHTDSEQRSSDCISYSHSDFPAEYLKSERNCGFNISFPSKPPKI